MSEDCILLATSVGRRHKRTDKESEFTKTDICFLKTIRIVETIIEMARHVIIPAVIKEYVGSSFSVNEFSAVRFEIMRGIPLPIAVRNTIHILDAI